MAWGYNQGPTDGLKSRPHGLEDGGEFPGLHGWLEELSLRPTVSQAAVPAHGLTLASSGASSRRATSMSYATCARSQYLSQSPKNRQSLRSVS